MKFFFRIFLHFALLFLIMSCARRSSPTGGSKDSIPPVLLRAYPKMNNIFFDKDEIELVFDEYIKHKKKFGNTSVIPTSNYFFGMNTGEEIYVSIEPGKTLIIRYFTLSEPN